MEAEQEQTQAVQDAQPVQATDATNVNEDTKTAEQSTPVEKEAETNVVPPVEKTTQDTRTPEQSSETKVDETDTAPEKQDASNDTADKPENDKKTDSDKSDNVDSKDDSSETAHQDDPISDTKPEPKDAPVTPINTIPIDSTNDGYQSTFFIPIEDIGHADRAHKYIVQASDIEEDKNTLLTICLRYGLAYGRVKKANHIDDGNIDHKTRVGATLILY